MASCPHIVSIKETNEWPQDFQNRRQYGSLFPPKEAIEYLQVGEGAEVNVSLDRINRQIVITSN
jgi:hypothetical protein